MNLRLAPTHWQHILAASRYVGLLLIHLLILRCRPGYIPGDIPTPAPCCQGPGA